MPIVSVIYPASGGRDLRFRLLPAHPSAAGRVALGRGRTDRRRSAARDRRRRRQRIALRHDRASRFGSMDGFQAAMGGPHAAEIIGDVANFTNIQPVIQINEPIGKGQMNLAKCPLARLTPLAGPRRSHALRPAIQVSSTCVSRIWRWSVDRRRCRGR